MSYLVGIIGGGFVGNATQLLFSHCGVDSIVYDLDATKCIHQGASFKDLKDCKYLFVCVPTPMKPDGSCSTRLVEEVILRIVYELSTNKEIIVRSTVPVGFCQRFGLMFMPEFLTEKNWEQDVIENKEWILGYDQATCSFPYWLSTLAKTKESTVNCMGTKEAEMVKYFRNGFLAVKVAYCNEIQSLCTSMNIDYNVVRTQACKDTRIGDSHTLVPGHDGHKGFGGTCLPKDLSSLKHQFGQADHLVECPVITAVLDRNVRIDRPEKDWEHNTPV